MLVLYGIRNCDTMKKARAWLDGHRIAYHFHDFKRDGLDESLLNAWVDELGWEGLVNRRGTTWRRLPQSQRDDIDRDSAIRLMLANTSLIRRPVLDTGSGIRVGFSEDKYQELIQ
jgi:arsenate reductase (glutaredoxin)